MDVLESFLADSNTPATQTSTPGKPTKATGPDYRKASQDLAANLYNQSSPNVDQHTFAKARETIDKQVVSQLDASRADYGRELYKQKYGETKDDISWFINQNQQKIDKDLYESLVNVANKQGVDLSKDETYRSFVAGKIKDSTPIEKDEGFWNKAGTLAKSVLLDTAVGTTSLVTDSLGITDNWYKKYFGERTEIQGNESFGKKAFDLFINQGAAIDYTFGAISLATGGLAAPALLSARTALGFGTKSFAKGVAKLGIEGAEDAIIRNLGKGGRELFEAMGKSSDDFTRVITKQAMDAGTDIPTYLNAKKAALYGLTKSGEIPASKSKEFGKLVNSFADYGKGMGMSNLGKQMGYIDATLDMLGLPTQAFRIGTKTVEGVEKASINMSFAGATFFAGLPALTLVGGGVGDFMQEKVFRTGNFFAEKFTNATRTGIVESERQAIIEKYGVDPESLTGADRAGWESYLNYRMKYANPSEIMTGIQLEDRSTLGQWTYGIVDTVANMVGVVGGMKAMGRLYGIADAKLSPITTDEAGNIVSNIPFLRELENIKKNVPIEKQQEAIDALQKSIEEGNPNFVTTIKTTRELESVVKELNEMNENIKGVGTEINAVVAEHYSNAIKHMESGDMESAKLEINKAMDIGNQVVSEMMQPSKYQDAKDKIALMDTYLKKVRSAESFHDNLIKGTAVNFFTTHITSPTAAFVRGTDSLVAGAMRIFDDIKDTQGILYEAYTKRSEYIKDWKQPQEGFGKALVEKIQTDLQGQGMKPEAAKEVAGILHDNVHLVLTQLYLTNKNFTDTNIRNLYDSVFTNFGIKTLTENLKSQNLEGNGIVDILRKARMLNSVETEAKITDALRTAVSEDALRIMDKINSQTKPFLQSMAIEIMQMDRLKADLATKLNHQRELEAKTTMFETGTIVEVENPQARIAELKEQGMPKEDIAELEKAIEEGRPLYEQKIVPEEVEAVKESPRINHLIADSKEEVLQKTNEVLQDIHEEILVNREHIQATLTAFIRYEEMNNQYMDISARLTKQRADASDEFVDVSRSSKYDDSSYGDQKIQMADDFMNTLGNRINETILNNIEHNGGINFDGLKALAVFKEAEIQHIYKTEIEPFISKMSQRLDGKWVKKRGAEITPEEAKKIRNAMQFILDQQSKRFDRDELMRMAKQSENVVAFVNNFKSRVSDMFPISDMEADEILKRQFGSTKSGEVNYSSILPIYNLYKSTGIIKKVKIEIGENAHSVFSDESPADFYDDHGNLTSHYRVEGLNEAKVPDVDFVFLDKITLDGKEIDLGNFFRDSEIDDKKSTYETEIFGKVQEEMEKKGYSFLGSFQEEGKKNLFVRSKSGEKIDPVDVLSRLIDTDLRSVENIKDQATKSKVLQNLSKYMKLSLWAEIKVDNTLWKNAIPNREDKGVIHLLFDDSSSDKNYDGRVFNMRYLNDVMNGTTGANSSNINQKAATVFGNGTFVKAQDEVMQSGHYTDPNILAAFEKAGETHPGIAKVLNDVKAEFGEQWKDNKMARNKFHNSILVGRYVDRIVPMSAYKNIFTRGGIDKTKLEGVQFEDLQGGSIKSIPLENIGLKMIDFYKDPEYTKEEQIALSTQFIRELRYQGAGYGITQQEINVITDAFNEIRAENYEKLADIMLKADENPILTIYQIEKEFGVKFTDHEKHSFLNQGNMKTMWNMASNIMKRGTLTGIQVKGNSLDLTGLPDYEANAAKIEASLPENAKGKWMVVSKEYYEHLGGFKDSEGNARIPVIRYPIVDQKVINAPYVVFAEDIGLNLHLQNSAILSKELVSKVEGDFDGDKIYAIADPRLNNAYENIYKFNDNLFDKQFDKVDNTELNVFQKKYDSIMDEIKFIGIATYEGKYNIGIIDKKKSEYVRLVNLGIIKQDPVMDQKFAVALQRAVDNKTVDFNSIQINTDNIGIKTSELGFETWRKGKDAEGNIKADSSAGKHESLSYTNVTLIRNGKEEKINIGNVRWMVSENPIKGDKQKAAYKEAIDKIWRLTKGKTKDKDGKINVVLRDDTEGNTKVIDILREGNTNNILRANKAVQNFFGKMDFHEEGKATPRNMFAFLSDKQTDVSKQYKELKPHIELLQKVYGKFTENDPQLAFLINHGQIFEKDFKGVNERLNDNINKAWRRSKEQFSEFGTNDKDLIKKVKDIAKQFSEHQYPGKAKTEEEKNKRLEMRESAMRDLIEIRKSHPEVNIDNIILSRAEKFRGVLSDLLSESTKTRIDEEMTRQIMFEPMYELSKLDENINPNKLPFMENDIMAKLETSLGSQFATLADKLESTPNKAISDSIESKAAVLKLMRKGYSNEQIVNTLVKLNNVDKNTAIDILYTVGIKNTDEGIKLLDGILTKEEMDEYHLMNGAKEIGKEVIGDKFIESQKAIKTSPENDVKIC